MSSLRTRIGQLERAVGDDRSRQVMIWAGPCLEESWIERTAESIDLYDRVLDHDANPFEHLTPEQRRIVEASAGPVSAFEVGDDRREPHLQSNRPPWKRRPYRLAEDGRSYELQIDGIWIWHEFGKGF